MGTASANQCSTFTNCADCLNPADSSLDCGWCSPDPVVFGNGTKATQCIDHTSSGWRCNNLYSHDGCLAGYVCDTTAGQCKMAEPGEGDTLENCEASCSKDPIPEDTYECDEETFMCVVSAGKYENKTCSDACADETPSELIGLWRGLNVQQGFTVGSYVANFTETEMAWGPLGEPRAYVADVAIVAPQTLRLIITAPASDAGDVRIATFGNPGYPTGPETQGIAIAIQRPESKQAPPSNVLDAMGDNNYDVFVMVKCTPWGSGCDFSPDFKAADALRAEELAKFEMLMKRKEAAESRKLAGKPMDECTSYGDCTSCLGDASGVCGWCDGVVTDMDGNVICGEDGNGCCGGSDGFSQCTLTYRKLCPVTCDYGETGLTPTCKEASTQEVLAGNTYATCDDMPWCTTEIYQYCDEDEESCKTLYSKEECEAEPQCDTKNPSCDGEVCKKISYIFCDEVLGCQSTDSKEECDANPACDSDDTSATCNPTECAASMFYTCDADKLECIPHTGPAPNTPYFNTTKECEEACVSKDISGVWRGLEINSGYVKNEWDFSITETAMTFKSVESGEVFEATYVIGDAIEPSPYASAKLTVTMSSGEVLVGVINNDRDEQTARGPVTKFMYIGLPTVASTAAKSFDAAMATGFQEFVLIACLDDGIENGCDFSSAAPKA